MRVRFCYIQWGSYYFILWWGLGLNSVKLNLDRIFLPFFFISPSLSLQIGLFLVHCFLGSNKKIDVLSYFFCSLTCPEKHRPFLRLTSKHPFPVSLPVYPTTSSSQPPSPPPPFPPLQRSFRSLISFNSDYQRTYMHASNTSSYYIFTN